MASRGKLNSTDDSESNYSVGSELRRDANIACGYLSSSELADMPDDAVLQRSLNIKSIISTSSSFARRSQQAVRRPDLQIFIQIGAGFQGAVFEQVGRPLVVKKEAPGNARLATNLRHEISVHHAVKAAFDRYDGAIESDVHVPRLYNAIDDTDHQFWQQNLDKFPSGYRQPTTLVQMDRILPLPKVVRKALIAQFYPNQGSPMDLQSLRNILDVAENKHCLVRTYLGRENGVITKERFSLRNFPLYLKSMERLGLDVTGLAASMGKAFALMHWGAGVNGDDVEFVLGTSLTPEQADGDSDVQHRAVGFYLLDFGQCDLVDLFQDPDVVYQAFKGAMVTGDNQLFIPNSCKSPSIFGAFKQGYMSAGQFILTEKKLDMKFNTEDFMREYEEYAEDFL